MTKFLKNKFPYGTPEWEKREKQIRVHSIILLVAIFVFLICLTFLIIDLVVWKSGIISIITTVLGIVEPFISIIVIIINHNNKSGD